jgi:uncharacterized coiled-coil DUF342 family protein
MRLKGGEKVISNKRLRELEDKVMKLESKISDLEAKVNQTLYQQEVLVNNDVALKGEVDELKKPKEKSYFG